MARLRPLCLAVVLGTLLVPAAAHADAGCDLYADPAGNDASPGTLAQPKQSPIVLLAALAPGQDGCLTDGATFHLGPGAGVSAAAGTDGAPKTLRPATPGARVTIEAELGFWFQPAGHDLVFKDLNFRRTTTSGGSLFLADGDRITMDGVDLTYPANICLDVGGDPRAGAQDPAEDFRLINSRVHGCGSAYGPPHVPNDSGVHGIYVEFTRDAVIENNLIYANHNRGIQLFPDSDGTIVRHNVLYGNGANLNIGSERTQSIYSEHNIVEDNIIDSSTLDGLVGGGFVGDTSEVLGNFPAPGPGVPDFDNVVRNNCVRNAAHPGELYEGYGFTMSGNIDNQDPQFADPGTGDFTIPPASPCAGKGPQVAATATCNGLAATVSAPPYAGTPGNDVIVGGATDDVIHGGGGNDTICGGDGFDTLSGGPGTDHLDGEGGGDGVEFAGSAGGVIVDLGAGTATGEGTDTLVSISEAYGSTHDDTLTGRDDNVATEVLFGDGGSDTIDGRGGPDVLTGVAGEDDLTGGAGNDTLNGGADNDTLDAQDGGPDTVNCGDGTDVPTVDPADTVNPDCEAAPLANPCLAPTITGTDGPDVIPGTPGDDVIDAKGGNDTVTSSGGQDVVCLGAGDDTFQSGAGAALYVDAGAGDDRVTGGTGADRLIGGDGDDTTSYADRNAGVVIDQRPDGVSGATGEGDDVTGFEVLEGTTHADQLFGGGSGEELRGLEGGDTLDGGGGSDALLGGPGSDGLTGGPGSDELRGGGGDDALDSRDAGTADQVGCGAGTDAVQADAPDAVEADCESVTGATVLGGSGPAGPTGPSGPGGTAGPAGPAGADGTPGATGSTGANGTTGATGSTGATGPAGPKGDRGEAGPPGTVTCTVRRAKGTRRIRVTCRVTTQARSAARLRHRGRTVARTTVRAGTHRVVFRLRARPGGRYRLVV